MSYIGNAPITSAFVTDQFSGTGSAVTFTMSVAPANTSSLIVAVTGVLQDPSTYAVSGTTLTFSAAPPTGTGNISVRYLGIPASGVATTAYRTVTEFTATSGQTTFNVPSYTVGYIDVYRNGVRLGAADFTATTGTTVVLASAASLGDLVTTESFYVASVLNAIQATAGAVGTTYLADAGVTTPKIADASVNQAKLGANVAGNGPAFCAYRSPSQSISPTTATKVGLDTEVFDTAGVFDSTSNYRFTPNVAGYYQVNWTVGGVGTSVSYVGAFIFKNGVNFSSGQNVAPSSSFQICSVSNLIYLNGSTDYLEFYAQINATSPSIAGGPNTTFASACLVRAV